MIMLYFYQRNIIAGRDFIVPLTFCSVSTRSRAIFGNEAMNYKDDRSAVTINTQLDRYKNFTLLAAWRNPKDAKIILKTSKSVVFFKVYLDRCKACWAGPWEEKTYAIQLCTSGVTNLCKIRIVSTTAELPVWSTAICAKNSHIHLIKNEALFVE